MPSRQEKNRLILIKALSSLYEAIETLDLITKKKEFSQSLSHKRLCLHMQNSVAQCLTFSSNLFFDYLKQFLKKELGSQYKIRAHKKIIKEAQKMQTITCEDALLLLDMIQNKEIISTDLDPKKLEHACSRSPSYYQAMIIYAQKLTPQKT